MLAPVVAATGAFFLSPHSVTPSAESALGDSCNRKCYLHLDEWAAQDSNL